jgi:hypothetical protein
MSCRKPFVHKSDGLICIVNATHSARRSNRFGSDTVLAQWNVSYGSHERIGMACLSDTKCLSKGD